ncbi:EscU/YscU/HrcU family type III secretion system export apparatus switch protein [Desulfotalea psychrophila]|uniref:Related to flagellar biosynthetic protein (FlhB) n=1 Tax=Desulfotalea psychrophila (strain LSv54 / DSM 12343) TaxID=177439 RepID=Q3V7H7_DESPS|nr:EscU/YscU/HrcU family type III secretion system export apparatus switch protein [Desulfotalea psychrophila]CAG37213.1 related to flagellar biosynthetic protein (FlhB) [Desulfotalea psychrophila LSv54]
MQKKAVALRYHQEEDRAPRVVASGKGIVAENIIETGEAAGVYIQEDRDMVELLAQIELNQEIPMELYGAVSEILSFVYKVNGKYEK